MGDKRRRVAREGSSLLSRGRDESGPAGHRFVPHTADVTIEAWGPTPGRCLEEAVKALVAIFAERNSRAEPRTRRFDVDAVNEEAVLVAVLEEIIFLVDTDGLLPVDVHVEYVDAHGARGTFAVLPVDDIAQTGSVPKAVSWRDLEMAPFPAGWRCRATIDV